MVRKRLRIQLLRWPVLSRYELQGAQPGARGDTASVRIHATVAVLLAGSEGVEPALGLLGQYFLGFEVSWSGALLGLLEAGAFGFGFGLLLAKAINATVALHERALIRRLEVSTVLDGVDEGVG